MIVVISIILVILALVIPASTTLWNQRKAAETENTIQGLLMTTRAKAMQPRGTETGFLAFVDDKGVQHLVSIEQNKQMLGNPAWQSVFDIADEPDQTLPVPIRTVPRYVVDDPAADPDGWRTFSSLELNNNDFAAPPTNVQPSQRNRNFFTMLYSTEGQLLIARDVLIRDLDVDADGRGDRTKLHVGPGPATSGPVTTRYYARNGIPQRIDPVGTEAVAFLITDARDDTVAINFASIDGLLVHDDSLYSGLPSGEDKRAFLLRAGQPLYVSRWTGLVIRGPVGETETRVP